MNETTQLKRSNSKENYSSLDSGHCISVDTKEDGSETSTRHNYSITRVMTYSPYTQNETTREVKLDLENIPKFEEPWSDSDDEGVDSTGVRIAVMGSFLCNVALFVIKVIAAVFTGSLAVIAAAVDSAIDIFSQGILYVADQSIRKQDKKNYPAGKQKLEAVAIILLASLMGMGTVQIIAQSGQNLFQGFRLNNYPSINFDDISLIILVVVIVVKAALYLYCRQFKHVSGSAKALANDHMNDVVSNLIALLSAFVAHRHASFWWMDAAGACAISVYIIYSWVEIAKEQIEKLVGKSADPRFLEHLAKISNNHHPKMSVDIIRAYHFGSRFLVEMEVVMPADMTVKDSHDIALHLQLAIERMASVERAFVHVDYQSRDDIDEHDWREFWGHDKEKSRKKSDNDKNNSSSINSTDRAVQLTQRARTHMNHQQGTDGENINGDVMHNHYAPSPTVHHRNGGQHKSDIV